MDYETASWVRDVLKHRTYLVVIVCINPDYSSGDVWCVELLEATEPILRIVDAHGFE